MSVRNTQQQQQAGNTKLTAVTITFRGMKQQFFAQLEHDSTGAARLPQSMLQKFLDKAGVRRGDTYTVG